ncbi:MAG: DUF1501 domain-containing protein [Planctomycetota bacterium]|jgi:uncharacterized protein (DUF1501 family)
MSGFSRRDLLKSAAAVPWIGPGANLFRWLPGGEDRCLLVLELVGGNDGLNTILPIEDPAWRAARPRLASVRNGAHKLGDGFALHPQMPGLHQLIQEGLCNAVHGVGYPKPSRSHFQSRDIWHTADPTYKQMQADTTGWLGRICDQLAKKGAAVPGLSVGSLEVPLALRARDIVVPSLNRIEEYQVLVNPRGGRQDVRRNEIIDLVRKAGGGKGGAGSELRSFLEDVAKSSIDNAEKLRRALARYRPKADYPSTALGRKLQLLARVMASGFGTRIFHVQFGGFDTHARQLQSHAALLRQASTSLAALVHDLRGHKLLEDIVILVHSEFGRRVAENRSRGTDHGVAGPVFFLGGKVKPGLHGEHPSLTDLTEGDLKPTADFRQLYGAVVRWLEVSEEKVLGKKFAGFEPLT